MKIVVAVVVYDRFDNVREWIRCFEQCENENTELVIIHNYKNKQDIHTCRTICLTYDVGYIQRKNVGYDIGALQDIQKERLIGFSNDWDFLFWVTDDVIPMYKGFIPAFLKELQNPDVGVACLEISTVIKLHMRTSGFMISKELLSKLQFLRNPVITKDHCYDFEHRGKNAFLEQLIKLGKPPIQVCPKLETSHLWDTHLRDFLNRWEEHYKEFPKPSPTVVFIPKPTDRISKTAVLALTKKVTFICPIYNTFPEIISCLLMQTYDNWELYLIHDGKNSTGIQEYVTSIGDTRIIYKETPERMGLWGFPIRRDIIKQIKKGILPSTDFIVVTNPDNYHTPNFIERYLLEICKNTTIIGAYCSQMIHNYVDYKVMDCALTRGYIDGAGIMFRADVACDMGWSNIYEFHSDWIYIDNILKKYGSNNVVKVGGCLLIHN